jgi:hypothetical protein
MAKTLIIVEDNSDKYTYEALIRHINLQDDLTVTSTPEIEWKSISDESNVDKPTALIKGLKALLNDISNEKYEKIGIIRDMDNSNKTERLLLINTAINEAFPTNAKLINDVNELTTLDFIQNSTEKIVQVGFSCHFVHLNNRGEIEDILKAIKSKPSPIADCVDEHLPICSQLNETELREKDMVKLWFNHYQRYDTLSKKERKSPFTTIEYIMKNRTDIFDFDKNIVELNELKSFLSMMSH